MFREKSRHFQVGQKKSSMHSNLLADFFSHFQVSMEHRKKHCLTWSKQVYFAKIYLATFLWFHVIKAITQMSTFLWTCLSHLIKVKKKWELRAKGLRIQTRSWQIKMKKKKSKTKNNQASKNLGYCSYLLNGNCQKNKHPKWRHHWKFS